MVQPLYTINNNQVMLAQMRAFSAKKKRGTKKDEGASTEEETSEEPVVAKAAPEKAPVKQTPVEKAPVKEAPKKMAQGSKLDFSSASKAQPKQEVHESLFGSFNVGDVKQIKSAPDHKPPTQDDTIEGRYATVLFTTASQQEALYTIYEDFTYLKQLYENSESFKQFTQNAGVGS
mmetsp:Transcript_17920/g.30481  ORF Transcript_17920/g.30481 Transcript_17920/m.30481 type:complete len:175 (-) Transcript_17920:474-998(-)